MRHILKIAISTIVFLAAALAADAYVSSWRPIKILAIGNSFSCDAVDNHLFELTKAAGKNIIIGNAYIGGCSLEKHLKCARENTASYGYTIQYADGSKIHKKNVTLDAALTDEDWDYITFQQQSAISGIYQTWEQSLPLLIEYVKSKVSSRVTFMIHQTWAYDNSSNHGGFAHYHNDQETMYRAIVKAVSSAARLTGINRIIPSGTAIQNARTTPLESNITRDGFHLHIKVGRYITACTWFESIFHKCVVGNPYCPEGMSQKEMIYAQRAAHAAVKNPVKCVKIR